MAKSAIRMGRHISFEVSKGFLAVCGIVICLHSKSFAELWQLSGQASENLTFDSNVRLSHDHPRSAFGSITSISGTASYAGPRFDTRVAADGSISRYVG